ncbi:tetratricopeptide repeat-containing sulfotransferase family protein [Aerolutibacter daejeonensis]|uniref:tetratricopeptide repeat-containing sulfotransferase family protein n=1 Tax=Aerolutibacter daejeonensis TaxID=346181 RepID=UPI00068E5F98|nr:sulfotransferase [Lysobacter daejeonensis]
MSSEQAHRHWLSAEAAKDRGDWAGASLGYRRALRAMPHHTPSLLGLSFALGKEGRHREARDATLRAWQTQPAHPALRFALAQRLRYFNEFERLVECLSAPTFAAQAPAGAVAKAAVMLSSIGAHAEAKRLLDAALVRAPNDAACLHVRGNLHLFDGELDDAEACYARSLALDPTVVQNAWMRASVRTQTPERNHVEDLRERLARVPAGSAGEPYLAYALHKELHDLGEYEAAWEALERGCRSKRRQLKYAVDDDERQADALIAQSTTAFLQQRSAKPQPAVPIFIVGMHRSGTTLLERILSGHPDIADAGETYAFDAQMQLATDHATPGRIDSEMIRRAADADFDAVADGYAEAARWLSRGKPYFTEKLPINFWHVGYIAKALPQARILHLVRDPMDTCFSNLRTLFAGVAPYSYDLAELGRFHRVYSRVVAHWREMLPGVFMDVYYDELVRDTEAVARRVADHCGLQFVPEMVDVQRSSGTVATASATLARQGIRRDRAQARVPYEHHLGPLREALALD